MANQGQSLWVTLRARTTKFEKGLKRARTRLRKFKAAIPGANLLLNKFTAALGVGALGLWGKRLLDTADLQIKFAKRLGVSVNRLRELEYAAGRAGVPVSALRMGLQRMTRRVAEAAKGLGEARGALKSLGLDARKLAGQSVDDQFRSIADAMSKVSTSGEQVRLTFKLFDSEGVALKNLLEGGAEKIDDYAKAYRRLGLHLTPDMVKRLEAGKDAFGDLKLILDSQMLNAVNALLPSFQDLVSHITKMNETDPGAFASLMVGSMRSVAVAAASVTDQVLNLIGAFQSLGSWTDAAFGNLKRQAGRWIGDKDLEREGAAEMARGIGGAVAPASNMAESVRRAFDQIESRIQHTRPVPKMTPDEVKADRAAYAAGTERWIRNARGLPRKIDETNTILRRIWQDGRGKMIEVIPRAR